MTTQRAPKNGPSFASRILRILICGTVALAALVQSGCDDATSTRSILDVAVWPAGRQVDVAILDEKTVIVVSEAGAILRSTDRGHSWTRARVPAIEGLAAISMATGERGWAVGTGVVLRTDDAGQTWQRQRLPGRASSLDLIAVAALDSNQVVVLGENGRRLRTEDAGAVWVDLSGEAVRPQAASSAIACTPGTRRACLAVGADVLLSEDGGRTWSSAPIEDAAGLPPFSFRASGVELDEAAGGLIREAALRLASDSVSWRVEAFVSAGELDRVAGDRDPSALLDLLSARTEELVGVLEAAGVHPEAIEIEGGPPWDYEEHLDDDPEFLSRYWQSRLAPEPMARVHARLGIELASVEIDGAGRVLAVGLDGRVLESASVFGPFRYGESPGPHELLDSAVLRDAQVVVGRQGVLRVRQTQARPVPAAAELGVSRPLDSAPTRLAGWITPDLGDEGAFFEALRAVDVSDEGDWGLAVGDVGRLVRTEDSGKTWVLLTP